MSRAGWLRRGVAAMVAVGALAALGALSRMPYGRAPEDGLLRLSWRFRGQRVEECRALTEAERSSLPLHMQRERICEGRVLPYRLRLWVDDRLIEDRPVSAAGAKQDRPIYLFREMPLSPGPHRLLVRFEVEDGDGAASTGDERRGAAPQTGVPPDRLELEAMLQVRAGRVVLVTYDADRRALVLRGSASQEGG